jgi:hypothetical protein
MLQANPNLEKSVTIHEGIEKMSCVIKSYIREKKESIFQNVLNETLIKMKNSENALNLNVSNV